MIDNSRILITGGTGSFGNAFINHLFAHRKPKEVIVYSRDEKKQHDMRIALNNPLIKYIIGDVRDANEVMKIMHGVDYVFHAAALKQVPSCEFFPLEAVKTNILGTSNVLDAAEFHNVKKVVVLSTDKAVYPINAMGISKAMMEKLMVAKSRTTGSTVFCGVRYGNVMYSRGSVIPLFVDQINQGKPLTITNAAMTRFLLPLADAVSLVLFALEHGKNGDLFVKKAPAATLSSLAQAMLNLFKASNPIETVGVRGGEKIHETLVTQEEFLNSEEFDDYFRIRCDRQMDYDDYFIKGKGTKVPPEGYTSLNTRQLTIAQTEELLFSLPEIKKKLS